jgi:hypothetical protein
VDLVRSLSSRFHGTAPGNAQQSDRLDSASCRLRDADRFAGEHCPSGGLGVSGVGFSAPAAGLAVRAVHLGHLNTGLGQEPGESRSPLPGSLDAAAKSS